VVPLLVARRGFAVAFERTAAALLQPLVHIVVIELLGPQHAGQCLAADVGCVGAEGTGYHRGVELVGLAQAGGEDVVERTAEPARAKTRPVLPGAVVDKRKRTTFDPPPGTVNR
jgi:hypothetical protein